eukprot:bmy_07348T0
MYILIITQRGKHTHRVNNIIPSFTREHALITLHIFPLLLLSLNPKIILVPCTDSSYLLVLGAKELVQLQIKVINLFSSFALITLLILIIPIMITSTNFYKNNKYPSYSNPNNNIPSHRPRNIHLKLTLNYHPNPQTNT